MAKKVLSAVLTLKDKDFSTNMKKAGKGVNGFDKRVKYTGNQVKRFAKNTTASFKRIATSAAGLATAFIGVSKGINFVRDSVALAKDQIEAETKLAAVMKNTKGVTDAQIQSVKNYASELQGLGVIGDEVQLSGVQQLATYQLQTDTLHKLMPGMNDLLAQQKGLNASQGDAVNIGNMVGKVMAGQVGALSRAGINFSKAQEQVLKFGNEQEKAAVLAEVLEQNVGGVNAALADTDQGKIQQMTNAWGDYKEEIGKKILPLQARFAGWFSKEIPKIQGFVLGFIDKGVAGFDKVKGYGVSAFNFIKGSISSNRPVIDYVMSGIDFLGQKAIDVKDWTVDAFQKIKEKVAENRPTIDGVRSVMDDLGVKAIALKDWMVSAFDSAQPSISWLKDQGLPLVVDGIAGIIDKATGLYNYINDNWSMISPIVYGVAGAILFYKTAIGIAAIATKGLAVVTGVMTAAKVGLNAVLAISPLGWIAIIIGSVIAIGVLLYKNWDTIREKTVGLWKTIDEKFPAIKTIIMGVINPVKAGIDLLVKGWDKFKDSITNFKMPKIGMPKFLGGNGLVQASYAVGTNRVPHDMIAQIHKDEMVIPASQSRKLRQQGVTIDNITEVPGQAPVNRTIKSTETKVKNSSHGPVQIIVNAKGITATEVLDEVVPELVLILDNM